VLIIDIHGTPWVQYQSREQDLLEGRICGHTHNMHTCTVIPEDRTRSKPSPICPNIHLVLPRYSGCKWHCQYTFSLGGNCSTTCGMVAPVSGENFFCASREEIGATRLYTLPLAVAVPLQNTSCWRWVIIVAVIT